MSRRRAAHRHRGSSASQSPIIRVASRFVSLLVLTTLLLASLFGVFLWLGETLFPLNTSQNTVFINVNLDGEVGKIYITHFSVEQHQLTIVPVEGEVMVD